MSTLIQSESNLQPLGRALVSALNASAQSLKLYPFENATVQNVVEEVRRTVARIIEREESFELRLVGDFLFLNDARLRLDLSDYASFAQVTALFSRHGVGEMEVEQGVATQDLARLISLLIMDPVKEDGAFERLQAKFASSGARHIRIGPLRPEMQDAAQLTDDQAKQVAKQTYFQSVQVAKEVLTDMRIGRAVNLRRVKRTVQTIVDQVLNNETSMLGMTTLRDYDEYTFTHSVNVCIFSVVLGQKLGLSKVQLYDLGLGALFHDIGKMRIDPRIVNKASGLTEQEWYQIQQHPTEGLLALFSMRGLSELPYRAMLLAYEHHMKVDLTGYPRNKRARYPTLFSRIVQTVDGFDAATSKRSYQSQPWPPDEVMREMRDNPMRGYDPLLVKAFINVTGVFPVGTLCILDTNELAIVSARNPDPTKIHQPIVKIISDTWGAMLADPFTVDLSEIDPATGNARRAIIKTSDPDKYGIRVADYFV
ncbi:MAG TPA: HD domain-containing phosphohydrolase [Longimicrobiales bacterium]